ncbi:MAG: hypothetical protein Kow00109_13990 [Acidobacteriota bacterium]
MHLTILRLTKQLLVSSLLIAAGTTPSRAKESAPVTAPVPPPPPTAEKPAIVFRDVAEQSRQFIKYYLEIQLSAEQQRIFDAALRSEKAVCCDDHPMADCCCVCNLSRTVWGLAKHLIANLQLDASETRRAVKEWLTFVNPAEFSGETCYVQRCNNPYHEDGCGGMDPNQLITG